MKKSSRKAVLYELISKPAVPSAATHRTLASRLPADADMADEETYEDAAPTSSGPAVRVTDGRLSVSLNTGTYVVMAGCLAAVLLVGYVTGRGTGHAVPSMKALSDATGPANPLLGGGDEGQRPTVRRETGRHRDATPAGEVRSKKERVTPAKTEPAAHVAPPKGKQLRLWVQSIKARSAAEKRVATQEAEHIRSFLAGQGVAVRVVPVDNGIIVMGDEGFAPGSANEADRAAMKKRVEQLGRLYRQQGGRYSFEGCFFAAE